MSIIPNLSAATGLVYIVPRFIANGQLDIESILRKSIYLEQYLNGHLIIKIYLKMSIQKEKL